MGDYLQLPPVTKALQWDGTNAAAIAAQTNNGNPATYGTYFSVDDSGNATIIIQRTTYPVAVGDWLVTNGNNTLKPMSTADFQAKYVAGSQWAVASPPAP